MSKLDLLKHTKEVTSIECSLCNRVETEVDCAEIAIDEFWRKGWKTRKNDCICPLCLKKEADNKPMINLHLELIKKVKNERKSI